MNGLLQDVLEAHGGLSRWRQFSTVSARISFGGGLFPLKGLHHDHRKARTITASLHEQATSLAPFGQRDWRASFRPERVAVETTDGKLVSERLDPRRSFDGHQMNTPWDPLHRAYFNGYALWTYLTTPFFMAMPGFEVGEIGPLDPEGANWRGLRVRFPRTIASHCEEQDFYFDKNGLLRRHDYRVDVAGSYPVAQYVEAMVEVQGLMTPTRRQAFVRGPDMLAVNNLLMESIDLGLHVFS
jgi:hypothetical protein